MVEELFIKLSLIIVIAVAVSAIMRLFKQPLLIGYIFTGIVVGPLFLDLIGTDNMFSTFSKIGIALLLFTVGLHLNPKIIKEVGKVALITGVGQVIFTSVIGFLISISLGFSTIVSIYIAIALTFSSTIIITKLLADKGDINSVYGRISIGFLIIQDIIAVFALMFISSVATGNGGISNILITFFKGIIVTLIFFGLSTLFIPIITKRIAKSQEFLFLFSIAWCLALASLYHYLNFSLEIGALFAGVALSISPYSPEISSKLKPLRDFFIVMFFIIIGSQMVIGDISQNIVPIIILSLFILLGNPLIVMILMGSLRYTKRNSFMAGLTVAQISEFSIILIALGLSVGHLDQNILSLVTMVGLITIAGSTYMINYSNKIYPLISDYLGIFEKKGVINKKKKIEEYDAILFGYNRIGFGILNSFKRIRKNYLVVDFNPDTISDLTKVGIPCLYGDAYDTGLLEELSLDKTQLVVSTIPDFETNELLIETIREVNSNAIIIVRAHQIKDALDLYKKGASYVLTPHFLGGEYISKMIGEAKIDKEKYKGEKSKHIKLLIERMKKGHEHPGVEKN
ncbi:sodium:proton exchanger [Candidatus Pacearchaeota archaeon]|jgi:Kef-type K+ transport system membrane component KefB/voltage-gated potassium channel Kch|nr:sodium:proton exchanger [Candidatus Pacearchaeota archaeon]|tara:strand:- start:16271 stop:17980 length:1710 start_codon:yes stop_codon:yes gene_type:complete